LDQALDADMIPDREVKWRIGIVQYTVLYALSPLEESFVSVQENMGVVVMATVSTSWGATAKPHTWKDPPRGKDEDLGYFLFPIASDAKKATMSCETETEYASHSVGVVRADVDVVGL
jgi:hypothetical protein